MDANPIKTIAVALGAIVAEVTGIEKVYTYPVWEIGRSLPCLTSIYSGLSNEPSALGNVDMLTYKFECTLYFAFEGRDVESQWDDMTTIVEGVVEAIHDHVGLDSTCLLSGLTSGRPVIEVPNNPQLKPRWIGHTFTVDASIEKV